MSVLQQPIPENVIEDLQAERLYQMTRGHEGKIAGASGWDHEFDNKNTFNDWAAYIQIYLGRAVQTSTAGLGLDEAESEFRKNMVKVATLAVAAVESIDRLSPTPRRHYDN